jgi:hypothetical protein
MIRIGFHADPDPNPALPQCGSRSGSESQGAKPMRIHVDPDPDPGQALSSQKVGF